MTRRPLVRGDGGAAALEFAFVFPVLLLFVFILFDLMMILWMDAAMESAVRVASRFGITGYAPAGKTREEIILALIEERTLGFVNRSTATISTRIYDRFDHIGVGEPFDDTAPPNGKYDSGELFVDVNGNGVWDDDLGRPGVGGPGEIVVYTATYRLPFLTPLQSFIGGSGSTLLKASAVVRNEPFQSAGG